MSTDQDDPLAQFGLDAIDLRWTLRDIKSKRTWLINRDHLPKLVELGERHGGPNGARVRQWTHRPLTRQGSLGHPFDLRETERRSQVDFKFLRLKLLLTPRLTVMSPRANAGETVAN
jgi:hypothetical protein